MWVSVVWLEFNAKLWFIKEGLSIDTTFYSIKSCWTAPLKKQTGDKESILYEEGKKYANQ
jgi:hypothetical protein